MGTVGSRADPRRELLRLIRLRGGQTAQQLAAEMAMTTMGVRRHLQALERDGLVQVRAERRPAGRPRYRFELTERGIETFPRNYDLLATQLLDAARARGGESNIKDMFAARMDQLVIQFEPRMQGLDLAGRVAELARIQTENGYMAVWEKVEGGYLLSEQNCAIYRVACRFQEACRYEIELFGRLLGAPLERVQHQVGGDRSCTYFIREPGQ